MSTNKKNNLKICKVEREDKSLWNNFVREHYPPVGAFMQTWEWGEFQKSLGRQIDRYFVNDHKKKLAAFTLVHHKLPFGFCYGYTPRGPVISKDIRDKKKIQQIFECIKTCVEDYHSNFMFLRLEPPIESLDIDLKKYNFHRTSSYVQPRYNHTVLLDKEESEILAGFHSSTRSNIKRAEKRGVTTDMKESVGKKDYDLFFEMVEDTMQRNGGKNIYPDLSYFNSLLGSLSPLGKAQNTEELSMGIFFGYQNEKPGAMHFVLFFGDTATYLFGASYSHALNSKVSTYLHFAAMKEAKRRGYKFYDLGGVDEVRWPTLTSFKRQFKGKEWNYMGNIDLPIRPIPHMIFKFIKEMRQIFRFSNYLNDKRRALKNSHREKADESKNEENSEQ